MTQRVYPKHVCFYCKQEVSANGLGKNAHYMKHVREGLCTKVSQIQSETGQGYYPPTPVWDTVGQNYETFLDTVQKTDA